MRTTIYLSDNDSRFDHLVERYTGHTVKAGEHTCVDAADEIEGAKILADVNWVLHSARHDPNFSVD